jgi:hypothetical protein
MKSAISFTLFFILIQVAHAVTSCNLMLNPNISLTLGLPKEGIKLIDYNLYENSEKILFLSDDNEAGFLLGKSISEHFPQKKVFSTGILFQDTSIKENYTKMNLDNRAPFPFNDNSFDTIIMRKGICVCHGNYACGGFCATNDEAKVFFERVIKVLDKNNPNSLAILHGEAQLNQNFDTEWKKHFEGLEEKYNVQVFFYYIQRVNNRLLHSILVAPNAGL